MSSAPTSTTGTPRSLPHARVERVGDLAQMLLDDVLDVPLVARLRPAALVVAAGHVLALVRDLDRAAAAQPEDLAALAPDGRDERAVRAPTCGVSGAR